MKHLSHFVPNEHTAKLKFPLLLFAAFMICAPLANACQTCDYVTWPSPPYYAWLCNPAIGPGNTHCWQHVYGTQQCILDGDPCEGGGPGCFLAGTMVSTPNGDRPIESLKEGDAIWCVSDDGRQVAGKVAATLRHLSDGYYRLNGSTLVTGDHRFLSAGEGQYVAAGIAMNSYEKHTLGQWVPLKDLSVGQQLLKISGAVETIDTMEFIDRGVRVYNLEVTPYHNYFANELLVHNKKPDPQG